MKRFERIDKKRRERFNFGGFFTGFYYSLRELRTKDGSLPFLLLQAVRNTP